MHPKAIELINRYEELGKELTNADPSTQEYIKMAKDRSELEPFVEKYHEISDLEAQLKGNKEILHQETDEELKAMAREENEELEGKLDKLEKEIRLMLLPQDELKSKNIVVEIRAGAGGEEAALFAGDLFRMYTRWAEIKHWKYEIINANDTGLGGYKEIIFAIRGKEVYGHLKFESGVHRVQRVPETESGGRVHTSTASVAVMPEVSDVEVEIDPKDIKIDVFRASGAGGQHVNKTDSAVRLTHLPSGIVISCQDERSQIQNRERAMNVLRARLFDIEQQKQMSQEVEKRRAMIGSGDRAEKIRTYNYPQSRVTDHRINLTLYKLESIMNGELDELTNALIMSEQEALLKTLDDDK